MTLAYPRFLIARSRGDGAREPCPEKPKQIEELANDLAIEKRNREAARQSLESKTQEAEVARRILEGQSASLQEKIREVERHSVRLAEIDRAFAAAHQQRLELSRRIQESNRLADEQEAASTSASATAGDGPAAPREKGEGEGDDEPREELEKLQQVFEKKTRQLEAVKERVRGCRDRRGWLCVFLGSVCFPGVAFRS